MATDPVVAQLRPDQVQEITTAFMEFDLNRHGYITPPEMKECLRRSNIQFQDAEVDRVMANMDTNHDGSVTYNEYMKFMARVYTGHYEQIQCTPQPGQQNNPPFGGPPPGQQPYGQSQPPYNQSQPPYNQNQPPYGQNQPPYGQSQPPYGQSNYNQPRPPTAGAQQQGQYPPPASGSYPPPPSNYPPPQSNYSQGGGSNYPPPQQSNYPPPQQQSNYPPPQQQSNYPPPQQQSNYPPPQQSNYPPPPAGQNPPYNTNQPPPPSGYPPRGY